MASLVLLACGCPLALIVILATFIAFRWLKWRRGCREPMFVDMHEPLEDQSYILPGPERIHMTNSDDLPKKGELMGVYNKNITTLYENFVYAQRMSKGGRGDCLGWRPTPDAPYQWISYGETLKRAKMLGSGLVASGYEPGQQSFIGIFAINRPEYDISLLATSCFSQVLVPIYDTLGPDVFSYIINHTGMRVVICDNAERLRKIIESRERCPTLEQVVVMDEICARDPNFLDKAAEVGLILVSFDQMMELGAREAHEVVPPSPSDLFLISYTSGTTGDPKGVMLTHEAVVTHISNFQWLAGYSFSQQELARVGPFFSYLPLAHNYAQCIHAICFSMGFRIGYFSGDIKRLQQDMKALRPGLMATVPRVLNRVYNKVHAGLKAKGPIAKAIFKRGYEAKLAQVRQGIYRTDTIWDFLVFRKVQAEFGGQLTQMTSGAAPISEDVLMLARVAFGCPIMEGYGQTENCSGTTVCLAADLRCGNVGRPMPYVQIKLADIPDMDYYAKDDVGEVCVRGRNVMRGYFKDPKKTMETVSADGWLHTGDVGQWLPNGVLKIVDRKKHIFKLAQGEYIAPEKLEGIYVTNPIVEQFFLDGRSLERNTVAVCVPEPNVIHRIAADLGIPVPGDPEDMDAMTDVCRNPKLVRHVLDSLIDTGKSEKLTSFEQIKAVYLTPRPFSVEDGLMTATMKLKRQQCRKYFESEIDAMYATIRELDSP